MRPAAVTILVIACLALASGCGSESEEREAEATPAAPSDRLHVSADAQREMGIEVETIRPQPVREDLTLTGWVMAIPGREVTLRAPVTGFVLPPIDRQLPRMGDTVSEGAQLAQLGAFVSPQEQTQFVIAKEEADSIIEQSRVTMTLVKQQLDALESQAGQAVSGARFKELQENYGRARAAYQEAQDRLAFLPSEPYGNNLQLRPVNLDAPVDGRIISLHVSRRHLVAAGDPLWTVADWSTLWVRVPVFAGDLQKIAPDESASVGIPGRQTPVNGTPVEAPQPTDPGRQTVDIYFAVENPEQALRPGQATAVHLPTGSETEQLVVPAGALIWDGFGGAWVYVRTDSDEFAARRVELGAVWPDRAVVRRGLEAGASVVLRGAQSLHSERFKGSLSVDDD